MRSPATTRPPARRAADDNCLAQRSSATTTRPTSPGRTALDMMDLGNPDLDWVRMASGMGVEAARADTCEQLADLLAHSFARPGPFVVEVAM